MNWLLALFQVCYLNKFKLSNTLLIVDFVLSLIELNVVDLCNSHECPNTSEENFMLESFDSISIPPPMPMELEHSFCKNDARSTKIDEAFQILNRKLQDYFLKMNLVLHHPHRLRNFFLKMNQLFLQLMKVMFLKTLILISVIQIRLPKKTSLK